MKASELRLGNWVLFTDYPTKRNVQITGNDIAQFEKDPKLTSNYFQPIPLSEEWLLKFGFEKNRHFQSFRIDLKSDLYNKTHLVVVVEPIHEDELERKHAWIEVTYTGTEAQSHKIPCKYVHQLQNLYYALAGEELTAGS